MMRLRLRAALNCLLGRPTIAFVPKITLGGELLLPADSLVVRTGFERVWISKHRVMEPK